MRYPKRTPLAVRGCLDQGQLACFVSLTEKMPAPETMRESMVPCDRRPQGERGEGQVPSGGRDSRRTPATLFSCTHMHVSPPLDPSSVVDVAFGRFFPRLTQRINRSEMRFLQRRGYTHVTFPHAKKTRANPSLAFLVCHRLEVHLNPDSCRWHVGPLDDVREPQHCRRSQGLDRHHFRQLPGGEDVLQGVGGETLGGPGRRPPHLCLRTVHTITDLVCQNQQA